MIYAWNKIYLYNNKVSLSLLLDVPLNQFRGTSSHLVPGLNKKRPTSFSKY